MGLLSALFGSSSYQTKADCDRAIARHQEKIAHLQAEIIRYKQVGATGIANEYKQMIARQKAEIARIRSIKASL